MRTHVAAVGALLVGACARYEYRQAACPPEPPSRSAVAWQPSAAVRGAIAGRVVTVDSAAPVAGALVRLLPGLRAWPTGGDGRFRIDSVAPGRYSLEVRRIGYGRAEQAVDVAADRGAQVLAALEARAVMLDGCGYAAYRVRKPWWKL